MKKYIFKVIVIFSFLLSVTSTAVFAADKGISASYKDLETYDYQNLLQKFNESGGSNPADIKVGVGNGSNEIVLTFHEDGWYIARMEVEVWDKENQRYSWIYSDSRAKGQKTSLRIDSDKYEINRVGYQIWFFGWDNDYMNLPWANTDYATDFTLSGYADYPEFSWKENSITAPGQPPKSEEPSDASPDDSPKKKEEDHTPPSWILNPNEKQALGITYTGLAPGTTAGYQEQGEVAEALLAAAIPDGWKKAFSFSLLNGGVPDQTLKLGTLSMFIHPEWQKERREYAMLCLDRYGKVAFLPDTDTDLLRCTVNVNFEGYAMVLLYKDAAV